MEQQLPTELQIVATDESYFTDHGIGHVKRVIGKLEGLSRLLYEPISEKEAFLLLVAAYCHDLGMFLGRKEDETYEETRNVHHTRSSQIFEQLNQKAYFKVVFDPLEVDIVKKLIEAHRIIDLDTLPREQRLQGSGVRTKLLGALLRIADASDCDRERAPRAIFELLRDMIPENSKKFWKAHFAITDASFDQNRSAIVISADLSGGVNERIDKYRASNFIQKELSSELKSVENVFSYHNFRLFHVEVRDFSSGSHLDFSEFPYESTNVILTLKSSFEKVSDLGKILTDFASVIDGIPLIIEISAPEGPLFISKGFKVEILRIEEMKVKLTESLGDEFLRVQYNEKVEKRRVMI